MLVTSPEVDAVNGAVTAAMRVRAADLSDAVLASELEVLVEKKAQLDALIADRVAVADVRDVTASMFGRSIRNFLVEELHVDKASAGRMVKVAREVRSWPAIEAAWRAAEISEAHALVIMQALRLVPPALRDVVEKALLEVAREAPPHVVAEMVDEILLACGVESSSDEAAARRYGTRGVNVARTFGGTGSLSGTLTPVLADKLTRALQHAVDAPTPDDERTVAQRLHDALERIVDHFLDTADEVPDQVNGEPPARVIVTIPLETLEGRIESAWGSLPDGTKISPATARRLACDAEVIPVVLGGRSQVLDMGRAVRTFSTATRRAAWIRDEGHCAFPGCENRPVECHHIQEWARGGKSDLDNAAWLCTFHHWLVHKGSWSLRRKPDDSYLWTSPHGRQRVRHLSTAGAEVSRLRGRAG